MKKAIVSILMMLFVFVGCKDNGALSVVEQNKGVENENIVENVRERDELESTNKDQIIEADTTILQDDKNTEDVNAITIILESGELKVDKEIIEKFYEYYVEHPYELSMLPEFNENQNPNESKLDVYIYLNTFGDENNEKEDYLNTFEDLFGNENIEEWGMQDYDEDNISFLNENEPIIGYFRLTDIYLKEDNCTYVAELDVLYLDELVVNEYEFASKNERVIRDFGNTKEPLQSKELRDAMKEIFLREDYKEFLEFDRKVEIEFDLDTDGTPFIYRKCHIE